MSNYHTGTVSLSTMSSYQLQVQLCQSQYISQSQLCVKYTSISSWGLSIMSTMSIMSIFHTHVLLSKSIMFQICFNFKLGPVNYVYYVNFPYTRIAIKVKYTSISSWGLSIMSTLSISIHMYCYLSQLHSVINV